MSRYDSLKKYSDKAYDKVLLTMYKGQRELLKRKAESEGMSMNAWLNKIIAEKISEFKPIQ